MKTIEEYKKIINIMYIEDDQIAGEKLKNILDKFYGKTLIASNGEDAILKLKDEKIDLIISDINMPKMDGLEFLEKLRNYDSSMPFIFVTARDEPDMMFKAIQLDIDNYVLKPIDLQNLLFIIDTIIEKSYKKNIA